MTGGQYGTPTRAHPALRPRRSPAADTTAEHATPIYDTATFDVKGCVTFVGAAAWTKSKTPRLSITVDTESRGKTTSLHIDVYGALVHHVEEGITIGERVHVTGRIQQYTFTSDAGYTGIKTELVAHTIHLGLPNATY
jgi:hypothetical protein